MVKVKNFKIFLHHNLRKLLYFDVVGGSNPLSLRSYYIGGVTEIITGFLDTWRIVFPLRDTMSIRNVLSGCLIRLPEKILKIFYKMFTLKIHKIQVFKMIIFHVTWLTKFQACLGHICDVFEDFHVSMMIIFAGNFFFSKIQIDCGKKMDHWHDLSVKNAFQP